MSDKTDATLDVSPIAQAVGQAMQSGAFMQHDNKLPPQSGKRVSAVNLVDSQMWAITPEWLDTIRSIASRDNESPEAVAARMGRPLQNTRSVTVRDGVAILPVTGPIFRYANLFTELSGATSLDVLAREFTQATDDPAIKAIVLEIDSPGGVAAGIAEFAEMVRSADKQVTAYVDGMAASAGYWIAAAADSVVISKTGMAGSVGAVMELDTRRPEGRVEIVSSQSPRKRPDARTDEGRKQIQTRLDALAQVFVEDVATYRGVSVETVLTDFGQGDLRMGDEAVQLKMADRVSTLEQVIAGLAGATETGGQFMATEKGQPAAEQPAITRAYLTENHPDIVQAIETEAASQARGEGTTAERERIQAILATPLASQYSEIVTNAIAEGETADQAALAILTAEDTGRKTTLDQHKGDAPDRIEEDARTGDDNNPAAASGNIEEQAKAEWEKDPTLHDEFSALETYLAYRKAEAGGKVRAFSSNK